VCVCLFVLLPLTVESLDLESSFLLCRYIFRIVIQFYIKVIGSKSRSQEQKSVCVSVCRKHLQTKAGK